MSCPKLCNNFLNMCHSRAILSTCNRTEVYVYDPEGQRLGERVSDFISEYSGVPRPELERYTYKWWDIDCVSHSLPGGRRLGVYDRRGAPDSRAGSSRVQCSGTGRIHEESTEPRVHSALRAGRPGAPGDRHRPAFPFRKPRGRSDGQGNFRHLEDCRPLVVGAGDAGRMVARRCRTRECDTSGSRTGPRGEPRKWLRNWAASSVPFQDLTSALAESDLVISSTGSPGYVADYGMCPSR